MWNHLLSALLLLFLLLHGSSTCCRHKGIWFNRPRRDVQSSLGDYDKQSINSFTTEEQNVKNSENIKVGLDRLREVLSNNGKDKGYVDPKVIKYFSERRDFRLRSPFWGRNTSTRDRPRGACSVVVSTELPKPLLRNFNDEFTLSHFLINVPAFQQTFEAYKCINVGNACADYFARQPKPSSGTCKQTFRHVKVLVLPNNKQYFNVNDFRVAIFEVEEGCSCVKPKKI
ncbi:uncharacterized protein LOC131672190 [Phymastichus coffea]|uniref:uncharacterized protein LOC131672190 n=1 Tax=Phymastichus coffea TaxID=108790 RepID=UPI00273AE267|nr:uncharacterized protein LOC131672190 [Phymastichus coffea]